MATTSLNRCATSAAASLPSTHTQPPAVVIAPSESWLPGAYATKSPASAGRVLGPCPNGTERRPAARHGPRAGETWDQRPMARAAARGMLYAPPGGPGRDPGSGRRDAASTHGRSDGRGGDADRHATRPDGGPPLTGCARVPLRRPTII